MSDAITTIGLTKKYGSFVALAPLDLNVRKGEVLGYLGPNGAGKTTTIRMILGLIKPSGGSVQIFGKDVQHNTIETHKHVAYIPGEAALWPDLTGTETLHLLGKVHGSIDPDYRDLLIQRFEFDGNKKVRTYSKGNRQKINIIAAFMTRADLLIMDEPTSGLDPLMERAFRQTVDEAKQNDQTIFLSSHTLEEVEALSDRVAILRNGKLVELGTLHDMRHLSALTVEATFEGQPPKVDNLYGVTDVVITGHQLNCQVHGSIDPLLRVITEAHPKTLLSRQPSLEELFLSLYGDELPKVAEASHGKH